MTDEQKVAVTDNFYKVFAAQTVMVAVTLLGVLYIANKISYMKK